MTKSKKVEFSHPLIVDNLSTSESVFDLTAKPDERQALAQRYGVVSVDALSAVVVVTPLPGGDVAVKADYNADVVQACVVTLEPLSESLSGSFSMVFSENPVDEDDGSEIEIDIDGPDPADAIIDGVIDIGEAVAEHVALEIDPFPRAEGAQYDSPDNGEDANAGDLQRPNPFAKLAALKDKLEQND